MPGKLLESIGGSVLESAEVQAHLEEIYGVEVSPTLISQVTDSVVEEVTAWQNRPLERSI
jgi:putative transposase